jgi:hypothetical protein
VKFSKGGTGLMELLQEARMIYDLEYPEAKEI